MEVDDKRIVGKRIRLARKMANMTQKSLLEAATPHFGKNESRISNWENGRSTPLYRQIMLIAQITGTSPAWIVMGYGPIRSEKRDIQAIRHQNLTFKWYEPGSSKMRRSSQQSLDITEQMVIEFLCNPGIEIDDASARLLERQFDMPKGWMDEQHVDHDPVLCALPEGIREILAFYSELPPSQRCLIRETLAGLKRGIAELSDP